MESLELSRSFRQPEALRTGEAPSPAFLRGDVDLEIGCGVGYHPLQWARSFPDRKLIAIEHTREKFDKFERRRMRHGCPANLLAVHANAITWVHQFIPQESLNEIFLLYPNPNLQNPAKRWIRMPFWGRLLDSLKVEGCVSVATNVESYALEFRRYATRQWGLRELEFRPFQAHDLDREGRKPRTHFEKKYLERGEVCFELRFQKISGQKFYFVTEGKSE